MNWLKEQQESRPELASVWSSLEENLSKHLYFQFTEIVRTLPSHPSMQNAALVDLYKGLLRPILSHLDLLITANLVVDASNQIENHESRLEFLLSAIEDFATCEQTDEQALIILNASAAVCDIELKRLASGGKRLESVFNDLKALGSNVERCTSAAYERARSVHCRALNDYDGFYSHSMMYLAFVDGSSLDAATKRRVAVDVSLSALVGTGSFAFTTLSTLPLMQALKNTEDAWVLDLVTIFAENNIEKFLQVKPIIAQKSPLLKQKQATLDSKIRILALIEHILGRSGLDRTFELQELCKVARLDDVHLELLVLKAFENGALNGTIDQIAGTVHFTHVLPRELSTKQICDDLLPQFQHWIQAIEETAGQLLAQPKPQDLTKA